MRLSKEPLYCQLKKILLAYIRDKKPSQLMGERELAVKYSVSRKTVRRAIKELTLEGYVHPVQGRGIVVLSNDAPAMKNHVLVILNSFEMIRPEEYEVYKVLEKRLTDSGLSPVVKFVDPFDPQLPGKLKPFTDASYIVVICCGICGRRDIYELLREKLNRTIVAGGFHRIFLRCLREDNPFFNFVVDDISQGIRKLADYLIEQGHKRIAFVGVDKDDTDHLPVIKKAMEECGLQFDGLLFEHSYGIRHQGFDAAEKLLKRSRDFTAIMAHEDLCALGVMERLILDGISIPNEVSVTGYNNLSDSKNYPVPLTTIDRNLESYADLIVAFAKECGNRPASWNQFREIVPSELIIRQSTGTPRT